jgi:nitrous oxidase accessory protein
MRELLILLLACLSVTHVGARTWRYRSGAGASLQTVINGTAAGDTVLVEGTVSEGSIRVDRPLVLLGGADAVIDGGGEDDALLITADHVTVKGFTIRGSRRSNLDDMSGIKVNECRGVVIEDNFLDKCFFAIYLSGVKDARVQGNTVLGEPGAEDFMANGIHLWKCSNATIRNNRIEEPPRRHLLRVRDGLAHHRQYLLAQSALRAALHVQSP